MKIASSDVTLASSRSFTSQRNIQESSRLWVDDQRPDLATLKTPTAIDGPLADVQISDASKLAQTSELGAMEQALENAANDPKIRFILDLISMMLGEEVRTLRTSDVKPQADLRCDVKSNSDHPVEVPPSTPASRQGWGFEYNYHESYRESEHTTFHSSGVIHTADDKEIKFSMSFDLQRDFSEESKIQIRRGDAKKVDPIVLNFSGNSTQLSSQQFSFDLDADGKKENISFVRGAGFLAFDRNGDGKINDGQELFGPNTGNGFNELKVFDVDHNGWIDENDPAFQMLKVWTKDETGKDNLASLKEAKVGALFLGNVSTEFSINDQQNKPQAQLVSSGFWLSEDGNASSLQHIDLLA